MIVLFSRCHLQEATAATGNPQPHSSWPRLRTHYDNWMAQDLAQGRPQWRRTTHGNRTRPSASSLGDAPAEFFIDEMPLDEEHDPDDEAAPGEAVLVPMEEFEDEKAHAAIAANEFQGFKFAPLGGDWTAEHIGLAWDRYRAECRGQLATQWCRLYHWPQNQSWAKNFYGGPDNVRHLARQWARKASFFYKLWLADQCSTTFTYDQTLLDLYTEEEEYLDWALSLDITSNAFRMVMEIKNLMPQEHPDNVHADASSSTGPPQKKSAPLKAPSPQTQRIPHWG